MNGSSAPIKKVPERPLVASTLRGHREKALSMKEEVGPQHAASSQAA